MIGFNPQPFTSFQSAHTNSKCSHYSQSSVHNLAFRSKECLQFACNLPFYPSCPFHQFLQNSKNRHLPLFKLHSSRLDPSYFFPPESSVTESLVVPNSAMVAASAATSVHTGVFTRGKYIYSAKSGVSENHSIVISLAIPFYFFS